MAKPRFSCVSCSGPIVASPFPWTIAPTRVRSVPAWARPGSAACRPPAPPSPCGCSCAAARGSRPRRESSACTAASGSPSRRNPARWCRPSTFWVTTVSACPSSSASAATSRCAAFGIAAVTIAARQRYQPQTSAGSARNAASVARRSASKRAHSPVSASRNVGMPLSAERPAPLSTTMRIVRWVASPRPASSPVAPAGRAVSTSPSRPANTPVRARPTPCRRRRARADAAPRRHCARGPARSAPD